MIPTHIDIALLNMTRRGKLSQSSDKRVGPATTVSASFFQSKRHDHNGNTALSQDRKKMPNITENE
jgi:hypothetical protein